MPPTCATEDGAALAGVWFSSLIVLEPGILRPVRSALGLDLDLALLRGGQVPASFATDPWALLAGVLAITVWLVANVPMFRRQGV